MYTVFLVEDDKKLRNLIVRALSKWGFAVAAPEAFDDVLGEFAHAQPHLVLMDVNLPSRDGFHWCARIREVSKVPVIFLSARGSSMDIVMAVGMGGDDYITKPFETEVLVAKVNAALRRAYAYGEGGAEVVEHAGAVLSLRDGRLYHGDRSVELTRNEFRILHMLMRVGGAVVSREEIMRELWREESFIDDNTLTVNVNRLRRRLSDAGLTDYIVTHKNRGYAVK